MRQDAANNRAAIVTATRHLLTTEGPGMSLRTIAKAASVGVATATRHFPERIELLDAVSAQATADIAAIIDVHSEDFVSDARTAWRATVHSIGSLQLATLAQAIYEDAMRDPETRKQKNRIIERRAEELISTYNKLLDPAKKAHLCPESLNALDFHIGLGIITRPIPIEPKASFTPDALTPRLIDLMLDGLEAQAEAGIDP